MGTPLTPEEKLLLDIFGLSAEDAPVPVRKRPALSRRRRKELKDRVMAVLDTLTHRESEIVKLRYGLGGDCDYTLEDVGRRFRRTRERVRQIEAKAIRKLQHPIRSSKLEGFAEDATR